MAGRKRTTADLEGIREGRALAATLGGQIRDARVKTGLSQAALARRVGLRATRISEIERGEGTGVPLRTWSALGIALGRPLAVALSRGVSASVDGPADASHLAVQELVLDLAAKTGRTRTFELPTRPADPARSVDVCIRDDGDRCLLVIEVWNDLRDVGAASRSFHRKLAEAEAFAAASASQPAYRVAAAWVMTATARNRELVARYPAVFDSVLPGSSARWVGALVHGEKPPTEAGLVWADAASGRIFARRRRGERAS